MSIGGLHVSDSAIRYVNVKNGRLVKAAIALPPGVVKNGALRDRDQFLYSLRKLRALIGYGKILPVVITALESEVFVQPFSIPALSEEKNLKEATELNLKALAPRDTRDLYYDAQRLEGGLTSQLDFLGAFVSSALVDNFLGVLMEAGFEVIAVEFPALSLARLARQQGAGLDFISDHLFIDLSDEGFTTMALTKGQLYLSRFISWQSIQDEGDRPQDVIVREVKQTFELYRLRFGGLPKTLIASPNVRPEFIEIFMGQLPGLAIVNLALVLYPNVNAVWHPALGAYLRGLVPRSLDTLVSLASIGTETAYWRSYLSHLVSRWRNIVIGSLAIALAGFLLLNNYLLRVTRTIDSQSAIVGESASAKELSFYQDRAREFNASVDLAKAIDGQVISLAPILLRLETLAGKSIVFSEVSLSPTRGTIIGRGDSEPQIVDFKNRLAADTANFAEVNLPLSDIVIGQDKKAVFTLNFRIK